MLADTEEVALSFEQTSLGSSNHIQYNKITYNFIFITILLKLFKI